MAVNFRTANGQPSTVQNIYTTLHAVLILAGWELVYADADAIGTGTASNPAWSKTPTINTATGTAIYRMPAIAGFATRWCVELKPGWAASTTLQKLQIRTGTDATAAGVLSTPGGIIEVGPGNSSLSSNNTTGTEWYASAYEHGLLIGVASTAAGVLLCLERRRKLDDTLLDDLTTFAGTQNSNGTAFSGGGGLYAAGATRTRLALGGDIDPVLWVVLKSSAANLATAVPVTLNRMDGATGIPAGPLSVSGGMAGFPRLFVLMTPNDAPPGVDVTRFVDGANHAYMPATATSDKFVGDTTPYRLCLARD